MKNKTKQFGQNFLTDKNIVEKILKYSDIAQDDIVVEIGPGKGALTVKLLNACKKLILIEIDSFLIETQLNELIKNSGAELINSDFLKLDLTQIIPENSVLIGNLPYSAAAKMIMKIAESNIKIKRCVFMIQKEMSDRILAKPSSSQYNAYTVLLNLKFLPQFLFDVSPSCFYPKPQVLSSVIKLTGNPEFSGLSEPFKKIFSKFAHSAFANKRKTLVNSVSHNLSLDKNIILESLKSITCQNHTMEHQKITSDNPKSREKIRYQFLC